MLLLNLAASVLGTLAAYLLFKVVQTIYAEIRSPLRALRGPQTSHFFLGNFADIRANVGGSLEQDCVNQYGRTFRINGIFSLSTLYTRDTKALAHILSHSHIYQKPKLMRYNLGRIVGPGVLVVEDDVHKQQNPAFGAPQIRELTPIFIEKSIQVGTFCATVSKPVTFLVFSFETFGLGRLKKHGGVGKLDVLAWFSAVTLDIIGLAGFNYKFNSLDPTAPRDELHEAFAAMTESAVSLLSFAKAHYPALRSIPTTTDTIIENAQSVMMRIARGLLRESKNAIVEGGAYQSGLYTVQTQNFD
ncbi:hypothetical protein C8J57DRAFT_1527797 [Mycena rebaudengoi]|nr:hypothetical protein C8J57DRAFT_1527797 [Mycena rebaudengoi]